MDVAGWLRELGLERYAQAFLDNDIAPAILPELTDQDLKDLGVSLGHRRLLLKAIKELPDGPARPIPAAPPEPPPPPEPAPRSAAERRQLTVMFVDLVGSTALSGRLDPEDMREVIRAYQNPVAGEIARFDGYVAKFMGDGVLAYFGYPKAHEDEAERAVRAGLAITAAIGRLSSPTGEALAARVAIATGLVLVGDLVGEGAAQEQAVVGDTPNLAARQLSLSRGNPRQAQVFAGQCLQIAVPTGSRKYMISAWRLLGAAAPAQGDQDGAETWLRQALKMARAIGHPPTLWRTHLALSQLYAETGRDHLARRQGTAALSVIEQIKRSTTDPDLHHGLEASPRLRQVYDLAAELP